MSKTIEMPGKLRVWLRQAGRAFADGRSDVIEKLEAKCDAGHTAGHLECLNHMTPSNRRVLTDRPLELARGRGGASSA